MSEECSAINSTSILHPSYKRHLGNHEEEGAERLEEEEVCKDLGETVSSRHDRTLFAQNNSNYSG